MHLWEYVSITCPNVRRQLGVNAYIYMYNIYSIIHDLYLHTFEVYNKFACIFRSSRAIRLFWNC